MRYKEFNRNRVLEKCINLFWRDGFAACPINEIVNETKVNRFSLYAEFENKEGILKAALELYNERYHQKHLQILNQDGNIEDVLHNFLSSFLENDDAHPSGSFTIFIATELADTDPAVKLLLVGFIDELQNKFVEFFNKYPLYKNDSDYLAKHLVGLFCNTMCFCIIKSKSEQEEFIKNGLNVILNKKEEYA